MGIYSIVFVETTTTETSQTEKKNKMFFGNFLPCHHERLWLVPSQIYMYKIVGIFIKRGTQSRIYIVNFWTRPYHFFLLHFHAVFSEIYKIVGWHPLLGPLVGEI